MLVVGEPGIGKTTLLHELRGSITDARVLAAAAVEAEQTIALAGLISLFAPVASMAGSLPPPHDQVLSAALRTGEPGHPAALGLAVVELLVALSADGPVVVLVDDAHWLDDVSARTIRFALRRLDEHPVAFIGAARVPPEAFDGVDVIGLDGLIEGEAIELLQTYGAIAPAVATRCWAVCAGNPLALQELGRTLSTAQRSGIAPLPEYVPVVGRLAEWLRRRLVGLPADTVRALAVVAAAGRVELPVLTVALSELGLRVGDLDAAEVAGVVVRNGAQVEFAHPLLRSAAVGELAPAERRAAHRALAAALPERALERRAWHLAEGYDGDAALATAALDDLATRAAEQGAHLSAADAWLRAAELHTEPDARAAAQVNAGSALWDAGRPDLATPLLEAALAGATTLATRARAADHLGQVVSWARSTAEATQLLRTAAAEAEATEPDLAVDLMVSAARAGSLAVTPLAVELAADAERIAERGSDYARVAARTMATHVRLVAGEGTALGERLADLDALGALIEGAVGRPLLELAQLLGFDLMVRERWEQARTTFERVGESARAASLWGVESFAAAMAAEVDWRTGRWSHARAAALVDVTFYEPLESLRGSFGNATLARTEAALGLHDSAVRHAALAIERGEQIGMGALAAWGRHALGLAHLAAGQPDLAVEPLTWLWRLERQGAASDPGVLWWHGDLLEALLATGQLDDARRLVEHVATAARRTDRSWAAAIAARGRGLLDDDPDALAASVSLLEELGAPFEAARSRLSLAGLRAGAVQRDELLLALQQFELLGAAPWIDQVRARLGSSGDAVQRRPSPAAMLTAAELRVALAVAGGDTNRQAADRLALSTRTVEAHLAVIYRKLGVRTRTQLALLLTTADGPALPG